jgi:hypothetical protein
MASWRREGQDRQSTRKESVMGHASHDPEANVYRKVRQVFILSQQYDNQGYSRALQT